MAFLRNHLLFVPIGFIAVCYSYFRFIATEDYIVEYEVPCDAIQEDCFLGYDDELHETYYYAKAQKVAHEVAAECGPDVTDCESANTCLPGDTACSITYCREGDIAKDEECEHIDASTPPDATSTKPTPGPS